MSPKLEYLTVEASLLRKNGFNSNQVSPENEAKIRESIERNGIFKPILVRTVPGESGYEIIGGEHRWEQAVELGYDDIPIVNLGAITETKAKEISVIDNARYGVDDTLSLAEILKDIGGTKELQEFLPYGDADLDVIFSSSDIALDDLDLDQDFEKSDEDKPQEDEPKDKKPSKTHTIMRFKLSLSDAERLTAILAKTQKDHGYTEEDGLTNAGDALVHLLGDRIASSSQNSLSEAESTLDSATKEDS